MNLTEVVSFQVQVGPCWIGMGAAALWGSAGNTAGSSRCTPPWLHAGVGVPRLSRTIALCMYCVVVRRFMTFVSL